MDPARADRERKIYIEAKRQGKSDDFIKLAVQRDRGGNGTSPAAAQREPIQVQQHQPGKFEKFYGWLEKSAPGRLGTALRGAVTGDGLTPQEQKAGIGAGVETAADVLGLAIAPGTGLVKNLVVNGVIGGTKSAGQAVAAGKDLTGTIKDTLVGVGSGMATTGLMKGTAALTKGVINKGAKIAANQVIKTPAAQTLAGKENLAKGMLERNMMKKPTRALAALKKTTAVNIGKQTELLNSASAEKISLENTMKRLEKLKAEKFSSTSQRGIQNVIDDLTRTAGTDSISVAQAQALKQAVGSEVGSSGFLADELSSAAKEGKRTLYGGLRSGIEEAVPGIGDVNKELEFAKRAGGQLLRQEAKATAPGLPSNIMQILKTILLNDGIVAPAAQTSYNLSKKRMNPLLAAILQRQAGQGISSAINQQ